MVRLLGVVAAFLVSATVVQAQGNEQTLAATVVDSAGVRTCTQGKQTRTVTLTSKDATKKTPCEVHYKKETEQPGHDQVIYNANNDVSFCEAKAQAFVEKLVGMGWTCN